jgi:prepilin-type N-terminal cleavage/methylation domain-containing protein
MKSGQKGYTLIELLIAVAILGAASTAIFGGTFQVIRNTETNSNRMTSILQVQYTGNKIGTDVHMAQTIQTAANLTAPDFLELTWVEASTGDRYEITYTFQDMDSGSMKKLVRRQSVNDTDNSTFYISQYIDSSGDMTTCNYTDGIFNLKVTAAVGTGMLGHTETRLYRVFPRPG